jgi:hypothetical protein
MFEAARRQGDVGLRARMRFQAAVLTVIQQRRAQKGAERLLGPGHRLGVLVRMEQARQRDVHFFEFAKTWALQSFKTKFSQPITPQGTEYSPERILALRREFDAADTKKRHANTELLLCYFTVCWCAQFTQN